MDIGNEFCFHMHIYGRRGEDLYYKCDKEMGFITRAICHTWFNTENYLYSKKASQNRIY